MRDHEWDWLPLFFSQRHELSCQIEHHLAIDLNECCGPDPVKDEKQQQRVFRGLSQCFSLFDQLARTLHCSLGFRSTIAFHVQERRYERDLELDFFAT